MIYSRLFCHFRCAFIFQNFGIIVWYSICNAHPSIVQIQWIIINQILIKSSNASFLMPMINLYLLQHHLIGYQRNKRANKNIIKTHFILICKKQRKKEHVIRSLPEREQRQLCPILCKPCIFCIFAIFPGITSVQLVWQ